MKMYGMAVLFVMVLAGMGSFAETPSTGAPETSATAAAPASATPVTPTEPAKATGGTETKSAVKDEGVKKETKTEATKSEDTPRIKVGGEVKVRAGKRSGHHVKRHKSEIVLQAK